MKKDMEPGSGASGQAKDVDIMQHLSVMQQSLKEMGAAFNGLERKIDLSGRSISSIETQLFQMSLATAQANIDTGPSLVEFDDVHTKVREEFDSFQAVLTKEFAQVQDRLLREFNLQSKLKDDQKDPGVMTARVPLQRDHTVQVQDALSPIKSRDDDALQQTPMLIIPAPVMSDALVMQDSAAAVTIQVDEGEEEKEEDCFIKHFELRESDSMASVFANDDDLEKTAYRVEDMYYKRGCFQCIARSQDFGNTTIFVVVLNAVYIGIDSDWNDAANVYEAKWIFQICSQFFCLYFTGELAVRFFAFEEKRNCIKDGWFKFDAFLVSTMILDTWILMPTLFVLGGSMQVPTQPLRMLRLFKITRMARLMKSFPELVTMIKGLVRALRAISSSMILIGLMMYVWAIMLHMLMKDEDEFNQRQYEQTYLGFDTIIKCMWTLFMDGTLMLDEAAPLMTEMLFSSKPNFVLAGLFFVAYALLSAMLILQMLIGVLCDVVSRVGEEQRDASAIGLVKQELLEDLKQFDGGDNKISQAELFSVMKNPHSKALMRKLNINYVFLLEQQKMMFDEPGKQVGIKEILELMIMCRGDNPATVESMAHGLMSIISEVNLVRNILETDLDKLKRGLEESLCHGSQIVDLKNILEQDLDKLKSDMEKGLEEAHNDRMKLLSQDSDKLRSGPDESPSRGHLGRLVSGTLTL